MLPQAPVVKRCISVISSNYTMIAVSDDTLITFEHEYAKKLCTWTLKIWLCFTALFKYLSVCPHLSPQVPLEGYSWDLILGAFIKIRQENPHFVKFALCEDLSACVCVCVCVYIYIYIYIYVGRSEIKERFAIQRYLLMIGKNQIKHKWK